MSTFCQDKQFRVAFYRAMAGSDHEKSYIDSRDKHKNPCAWWSATLKYYQPKILEAEAALKAICHHQGDNRCRHRARGLLNHSAQCVLLAHLASRLDFYAWQYHRQLRGDDIFPDPSASDLHKLYRGAHAGTLAAWALTTITRQFVDYIAEIIDHLDNDWDEIGAVFFPDWTLRQIETLIPATHHRTCKQGKSVFIAVFQAGQIGSDKTSELRLVYKPSNLYIDYQIIGDTRRVRTALEPLPDATRPLLKSHPQGSLFEVINGLIGADFPTLPVYPILPKNIDQVTTAYGYAQYLGSGATTLAQEINSSAGTKPPPWHSNCTTSRHEDLSDYYRLLGWYVVISLNFGISDIHSGNLVVYKKKPYMVDLEISFRDGVDSIEDTGMEAIMATPAQFPKALSDNIFYRTALVDRATNGTRAGHWLCRGMNEAMGLLAADPDEAISSWLQSPHLANAVVRYLPDNIDTYLRQLEHFYLGENCLKPAPPPSPSADYFVVNGLCSANSRVRDWYDGTAINPMPNYSMSSPEHDWCDYLYGDIPVYYRRLKQMDLLNARGEIVSIHAHRDRPLSGNRYFDYSPAVCLFQVDLKALGVEQTHLPHLSRYLIEYLRPCFRSLNHEFNGAEKVVVEKPDSQWCIYSCGQSSCRHSYRVKLHRDRSMLTVYKAGSAIEGINKRYSLFKNDQAFRDNLMSRAQKDVASHYIHKESANKIAVYNDF